MIELIVPAEIWNDDETKIYFLFQNEMHKCVLGGGVDWSVITAEIELNPNSPLTQK